MTPANKWTNGIRPDEPVSRAAIRTLKPRLKRVGKLFSKAVDGLDDAEPLHQLRVATRRASAALELYADVLPSRRTDKMQKLLKHIRQAAGAIRDCDIILARFAQGVAQDEAPILTEQLRARRREAQRGLACLYHKWPLDRVQQTARSLLRRIERKSARHPQAASVHFAEWAPKCLATIVADFFESASPDLDDFEALHRFRIRTKALRYAIELVADAFPPELRADAYPVVERLQDLLGSLHDESMFLQNVAKCLPDAGAADAEGLRHRIADERKTLAKLEREFAGWWTPEQCDELKARFEHLAIAVRA
jgi:CHAD domain-containing protein